MIKSELKIKYILISVLLTVLFSGVLFVDLNKELIAKHMDAFGFLSFMSVAKNNMLAFSDPLTFTDYYRYPVGIVFRMSSDGVFAIFTGAVLSIFLNPALAYNLVVLIIFLVNLFVSMYFFTKICRLYNVDDWGGLKPLISTLIFALSPYFLSRILGQLNLAFIAGLPFLSYTILAFERKFTSKEQFTFTDYFWFFMALIVTCMGSLQYFIVVSYIFVFTFMIALILNPLVLHRISLELIRKVSETFGVFFIPLLIFIGLFLYFWGGYAFGILTNSIVIISAYDFDIGVRDFIIPNSYLGGMLTRINNSPPDIEKAVSMGFVSIFLAGYFVFKAGKKSLRRILLSLLAIYFLLGTSLVDLPAYYEANRFVIFLLLFLAILFLLQPSFVTRKLAPLIIILLVVERLLTFKIPVTRSLSLDMYAAVRDSPGEAVLVLPVSIGSAERDNLISFAGKKLIDGHIHHAANNKRANAFLRAYMVPIMCATNIDTDEIPVKNFEKIIPLVKQLGVSTVIVEYDTLKLVGENSSCKLFTRYFIETYQDKMETTYSDESYSVFVLR